MCPLINNQIDITWRDRLVRRDSYKVLPIITANKYD